MLEMTSDTVEQYWLAIDVIEAQQALVLKNLICFPKFKQSEQRKLHKELEKSAYPFGKSSVSVEDFFNLVKMGKI